MPQFLDGSKDGVFRGVRTGFQDRRDFLDPAAFPMPHHESSSLRLGKSSERLLHLLSQFDALRQTFRRRRLVLHSRQWIVLHPVSVFRFRHFPPSFFLLPLPHAVNRVVRRDSIDPSSKICASCELPHLLIPA